MKYQNEGGPSLKQCFELLREASTAPVLDLQSLLDAVIFNYLISNYDAHGKNFSIVYSTHGGYSARLAPLYDLICTEYYPDLSKKMAMKIGGEYLSEKVFPRHFEKLAEEAGLAKPLVKRRVPELAEALIEALDKTNFRHPPAPDIAKIIEGRSREAVTRFKS
jgi:serine/threonine-protein kinase HipA